MLSLLIAALALSLCTALRWYLDRPHRKSSTHLGGFLCLEALHNPKGAFSLPLGQKLLLPLSAGAMTLALTLKGLPAWGRGLLLGGGASNFSERHRRGSVFDYLRFPKAPGTLRRYVFNLADLFIFLGAFSLLFSRKKRR